MNRPAHRRAQVHALVDRENRLGSDRPGVLGWMQRLCRAAARELTASGVGVCLIADSGAQLGLAASDALTQRAEELQVALGEGPCIEAYATRRPVLAPDLRDMTDLRWPGYTNALQGHGIRAVFAFPLQIGAARMGAMDVYRDTSGTLSGETLGQALTFAEVATNAVLNGHRDLVGPDAILQDSMDHSYEVFQAQGMVMVQLGVNPAEAMVRIRAHAYAQERRLTEVAGDIVAGKLVLEPDQP